METNPGWPSSRTTGEDGTSPSRRPSQGPPRRSRSAARSQCSTRASGSPPSPVVCPCREAPGVSDSPTYHLIRIFISEPPACHVPRLRVEPGCAFASACSFVLNIRRRYDEARARGAAQQPPWRLWTTLAARSIISQPPQARTLRDGIQSNAAKRHHCGVGVTTETDSGCSRSGDGGLAEARAPACSDDDAHSRLT